MKFKVGDRVTIDLKSKEFNKIWEGEHSILECITGNNWPYMIQHPGKGIGSFLESELTLVEPPSEPDEKRYFVLIGNVDYDYHEVEDSSLVFSSYKEAEDYIKSIDVTDNYENDEDTTFLIVCEVKKFRVKKSVVVECN